MKTVNGPVLDRFLDPLGRILTPEVARNLVKLRCDPKAQARIDKLARKCNEGLCPRGPWRKLEIYT